MNRSFSNNAGFSLTELLMAMLFAGFVTAALFSFYRDQLFMLLAQETRVATLEDTRGALDLMVRELRSAGAFSVITDETCAKDDSGRPFGIVASDARSIVFQSDLDSDGDCSSTGEKVSYRLTPIESACSVIKRNGTTLVGYCSGSTASQRVGVRTPGGSLFTYFDGSDSELDASVLSFDIGEIKRVRITMAIEQRNPDSRSGGNISTALSSSVYLRN